MGMNHSRTVGNVVLDLLRKGLSYQEIGRALGVSRNAVAGYIDRARRGMAGEIVVPPVARRTAAFSHERASTGPFDGRVDVKPDNLGPLGPANSFGEGCQWIYGHPSRTGGATLWRCCDRPKRSLRPYCEAHDKRARTAA